MEIEAETRRSPSLDAEEVRRFETLAKEWWDERGKFRALHAINPARLAFIAGEVQRWRGAQGPSFRPLDGLGSYRYRLRRRAVVGAFVAAAKKRWADKRAAEGATTETPGPTKRRSAPKKTARQKATKKAATAPAT